MNQKQFMIYKANKNTEVRVYPDQDKADIYRDYDNPTMTSLRRLSQLSANTKIETTLSVGQFSAAMFINWKNS